MTIKIGSRAGNLIVPYTQTLRQTKLIDLTLDYTGTPLNSLSNVTKHYAKAIFYNDSLGNWFMDADISLTADIPTGTNFGLKITGIVSKNATNLNPVLDVYIDDSTYIAANPLAIINPNNNLVAVSFASTTGESGKSITLNLRAIALNAEPTTYTIPANMEALTSANIYMDHGTALTSGVVGGSNGNGIVAGRIGSIVQATAMTDYEVPDTTFTKWNGNDNSKLLLNKGRWMVIANINVIVAIAHSSPAGARLDINTEIVEGATPTRVPNQSRLSGIALANATTSNYTMNVSVHAYNFILDVTSDNYPLWIRGRYVASGSAVRQSTTLSNTSDRNSNFYAILIG